MRPTRPWKSIARLAGRSESDRCHSAAGTIPRWLTERTGPNPDRRARSANWAGAKVHGDSEPGDEGRRRPVEAGRGQRRPQPRARATPRVGRRVTRRAANQAANQAARRTAGRGGTSRQLNRDEANIAGNRDPGVAQRCPLDLLTGRLVHLEHPQRPGQSAGFTPGSPGPASPAGPGPPTTSCASTSPRSSWRRSRHRRGTTSRPGSRGGRRRLAPARRGRASGGRPVTAGPGGRAGGRAAVRELLTGHRGLSTGNVDKAVRNAGQPCGQGWGQQSISCDYSSLTMPWPAASYGVTRCA